MPEPSEGVDGLGVHRSLLVTHTAGDSLKQTEADIPKSRLIVDRSDNLADGSSDLLLRVLNAVDEVVLELFTRVGLPDQDAARGLHPSETHGERLVDLATQPGTPCRWVAPGNVDNATRDYWPLSKHDAERLGR